jgi:hypothetical protein
LIIAEGNNKLDNDINLAVCIFTTALCKNKQLGDYMNQYTKFYANRFIWISDKIDIHIVNDIDHGLDKFRDTYDHILFMAGGCRIYDSSIIVDVADVIRKEPEYLAAAHILDWKERWYELHHQFVLINVNNWKKAREPFFGSWDRITWDGGDDYDETKIDMDPTGGLFLSYKSQSFWQQRTLPVVERSKENFHDDYTPLWIKNTGETFTWYNNHVPKQNNAGTGEFYSLCPGWKFIVQAYKHNMTIHNWDQKIRSKRTYYYPEEKSDILWQAIKDKKQDKQITNYNQKQFLQLIEQGVQEQIWLLNSEDMYLQNEGKQYSTIALPASGFKFLDSFHSNAIKPDGTLILYDFNPLAIQWMEHIYNSKSDTIHDILLNYKGDTQHFKWFGNNRRFVNADVLTNDRSFQQGLKLTNEYFNNNTTKYIEQFRKQNVKFIQVDLIKNPEDLLQDIKGDSLIHISNIFSTDWLIASEGLIKAQQYFNSFLSRVEQQSIRITGHSPSGEWL